MLDTLIVTFKLKNTYRVNTIIYGLRNIPGFRRLLKSSLYGNETIKVFVNILSFLMLFFIRVYFVLILNSIKKWTSLRIFCTKLHTASFKGVSLAVEQYSFSTKSARKSFPDFKRCLV